MASYVLAPNKAYPSIPTISGTLENHTLVLGAIQESLAIYERRTGNAADSFVRLSELEDLGIINIDQTTNIVVAPDDDGVFIRRDGTSPRTTGEIDIGAGLNMDMSTCIAWDNVDYVCVESTTVSGSTSWPEPSAFSFQAAYIRPHLSTVGGPMYSVDGKKFYSVRDDGSTSQIAVNSDSQGGKFAVGYVPEEVAGGELVVLVSRGSNRLRDCVWGENGTSILAVEYGANQIAQYNHTGTAYDLDTAAETDSTPDATFALSGYTPRSIDISSDGTKIIFVANTAGRNIYEVTLSTAWDITSGTINTTSFQPSDEDMICARFAPDGLAIFALGLSGVLYRYPLTTAYDISTADTTASSSVSCVANLTYGTSVISFNISPDGTKLHVHEYHVSNASLNACQYYTASNPVSSTTTYTMTVGDPSAAMEIDATGVNLDTSVAISWNDTDFLVFDTSFAPGSEPVTDPYFGFVTCLVTVEAATIGAATFTSDIGDITWTWVGDNTEGTGGEWGYPTDESAKHGTMSVFTRGSTGATFEGFGGPAQNSAEAVAAFPLNEGTTGEFCVDFWVDPALYNGGAWTNDYYVISSYNTQAASIASFRISLESGNGRASLIVPTGAARTIVLTQAGDVVPNFHEESWHHYAFTRESDGEFRCYVDGVLKQRSGTGIYPSMASVNIQTPTNSQVLVWGGSLRTSGPNGLASAAYVDSFRITKGSARYYDGGAAVGTDIFGSTIDTDAGVPQGTPGTIGFKVGDETLAYTTDIYGSAINLKNPVTAASTVDITGAVTMASTLGVTGAVTMSSTLGVTGATTLSSTLGVTGATTLSDTLGVTGATTLSSTLAVTGISTFNSDIVLDAGTNTATWSSDDTDLTLTSVGLTDLNVTGFTAVNMADDSGIEWGDTEFIGHTTGVAGVAGDPYFHLVVFQTDCEGSDAATTLTEQSGYVRSLTFNGNAQIDTAQFKWGTSSLLFDGTGDYLSLPDSSDWDFGTGDFTVEGWIRYNVSSGGGIWFTTYNTVGPSGWAFQHRTDSVFGPGTMLFTWGDTILVQSAWVPSDDTWYHVAATRSGTTLSIYVDGVRLNSATNSTNITNSKELWIGRADGVTPANTNGWIDSPRFTKGYARYTGASFTVPTADWFTEGEDSSYSSVVLNCAFDGSDAATSSTDDSDSAHTLTFNGNAQLDTAIVKSGTASLLLDGTGDYVSIPFSTDFEFGSGDFTVEGNFYFSGSLTTRRDLICFWDANGANRRSWMARWAGDLSPDSLEFVYSTTGTDFSFLNSSSWTPTASTWYHLAWARDGNTMRFYANGVQISSTALTATIYSPGSLTPLGVGAGLESGGWSNPHNGSIDNVRITKGVCRYPSGTSFTPPVVHATQGPAAASPDMFSVGEASSNLDLLGTVVTVDGDFVIEDATNTDSATFDHDGTDFNTTFVTTTDWNITGITSIQAGTVDAVFDAITGSSFVGIDDTMVAISRTLGTPTADSLDGYFDSQGSTGSSSGGAITDNADGTIAIAAWEGYLRSTSTSTAPLYTVAIATDSSLALTDNAFNFIYADYNSGTPQFLASTSLFFDDYSKAIVGGVHRAGTELHITDGKLWVDNFPMLWGQRSSFVDGIVREDGLITSETGTRNIAITAGNAWVAQNRFSFTAKDTSVADTFTAYYQDGVGGFTAQTAQTQISNANYDDGTGVLASLSTNRYGVHWLYRGLEGHIYAVYGRGDYTQPSAEAATVPANIPPHIGQFHGVLIAKIIVQQGATSIHSIQNPFVTQFAVTGPTAHSDLTGLASDDHPQYAEIAAAETITGSWTIDATLQLGDDLYFDATLGDRLSLYDNRLDATNMYGFGTESGTLYSKSPTYHRWYIGANADGGTSDSMQLDGSNLDLYAGIGIRVLDSTNTDALRLSHDGTDANWTCTGTIDLNFSGVTGLYDFATGLVQGVSFASNSSSPASSSGAITFDVGDGDAFEVTLTENITAITLTPVYASGKHLEVTIKFIQDATGSWTVSGWPASVKWPGGTAPTITTTLSTGTDIIILETWDAGTTWYGRFFQDYQ